MVLNWTYIKEETMKIYAIQYCLCRIENKDVYKFYTITCKFLSSRVEINENFYEQLKSTFNIAHKNNSVLSGIYFDSI